MRIFLDTEYTNPTDRELISLGMVSEDGTRELYLERTDFPREQCNAFVLKHVLPLLGASGASGLPSHDLGPCLHDWFRSLPRSVRIAADSSMDLALLRRFLGADPTNLARELYDLRPLIDTTTYHSAVERYYGKNLAPRHHALHDARAHRDGFLAWADQKKFSNRERL